MVNTDENARPIVLDEETTIHDVATSNTSYPYDPRTSNIDIKEDPLSVFELIRRLNQQRLIINPEFQRNLVWDIKKKSRFVESIILDFPIPPLFFNQQIDGKYVVVDGLQRITTLQQFLNNEFKLKGLKSLDYLNDCSFNDLADISGFQARIEDKKLLAFVIKPSVPIKVVHDIFNRINTGGTQLNKQEVRNAIYNGKSTRLLKELSETKYFKQAINNGLSPKRMKDQEAVLRCLAFQIFDYSKEYKGNISDFVELAMEKINKMPDEEIHELKQGFERTMKLTFVFFGHSNFRLSKKTPVNLAILDSVFYFFYQNTSIFLENNRNKITQNFTKLLQDKDYHKAVTSATSIKAKVMTRFDKVKEILGNTD